jgi:hypothetical protein
MSYAEVSESEAILESTEHFTIPADSRNEKSAPMSAAFWIVASDIVFFRFGSARAIRALRIAELFNIHVFCGSAGLALDKSFTAILQHDDETLVGRGWHLNETHKATLHCAGKYLLYLFAHWQAL